MVKWLPENRNNNACRQLINHHDWLSQGGMKVQQLPIISLYFKTLSREFIEPSDNVLCPGTWIFFLTNAVSQWSFENPHFWPRKVGN
jgi:hypothetical protein